MPSAPQNLTLWEHLDVLRHVLFKCMGALVVCSLLGLLVTSYIFQLLLFPIRDYLEPALQNCSISESSAVSANPSPEAATEKTLSRLLDQLNDPALTLDQKVDIQSRCLTALLEEKRQITARTTGIPRIRVIYSSPVEPFMIRLKLAFLGGAIIAIPFLCYFLWGFVSPGIRRRERRLVLKSTVAATGLFLTGASFGYSFLPLGIPALLKFSAPGVEHIWSLQHYIGFCTRLILAFGLAFEMPFFFGILGHFGFVNAERLIKGRVYALILIFVVAAWLTPPDIYSQIALALPMLGLYELSVFIVKKINKGE